MRSMRERNPGSGRRRRTADFAELNKGKTLTHKNTSGLAYKAGNLYDWAKKSSWDRSANVLICRQPDGSDYYMYYK